MRGRGRRALPILAVTAVAVLSSLPAWFAPVRWTPDGLFYQARLEMLRGASPERALADVLGGPIGASAAARLDGPQLDRLHDEEWVAHTAGITRRRVLVPALGAAITPLAGDFSLQAVSLLGYLAVAPLLYLLLRRRFAEGISAAVTVGVVLLPPLREWSFHPLTDSWGVALLVAALLAAARVRERGLRWLPLWVGAVGALSLTRDAAVVAVAGAAWLALRERTRAAVALTAAGVLAAAPAPLLLGAPVGGTVGHAVADGARYWDALAETVRVNLGMQVVAPQFALAAAALALAAGAALGPEGIGRRLRLLALGGSSACLAIALAASALLTWRGVEPAQQVPVGLVFAVGLAGLLLPAARPDALLAIHRGGAVAACAYLLLFPIPSGFRLELVFLPFVAYGLARIGERALAARRCEPARPVRPLGAASAAPFAPPARPTSPRGVSGARHRTRLAQRGQRPVST